MATDCPALNSFTSNPQLVTVENQKELRLSTYNKSPGTTVNLWCESPFNLYGQSKVTCQSDGTWDFSTKPCCDNSDCNGTTNTGLTEQTKILIGVLVSVAVVIVIILLCITCIIMSKIKKKEREQKKLYRESDSSRLGYMLDERAFFPPPYSYHPNAHPYNSLRRSTTNSHENIAGNSTKKKNENQFSSEIVDNGRNQKFPNRLANDDVERPNLYAVSTFDDIYRKPKGFYTSSVDGDYGKQNKYPGRSPSSIYGMSETYQTRLANPDIIRSKNAFKDNEWNKPLDNVYIPKNKEFQAKKKNPKGTPSESLPSTVYTGHWPVRSEMKELKEFNRRALLHGRDPFLWTNVNSNFGFHINYDD